MRGARIRKEIRKLGKRWKGALRFVIISIFQAGIIFVVFRFGIQLNPLASILGLMVVMAVLTAFFFSSIGAYFASSALAFCIAGVFSFEQNFLLINLPNAPLALLTASLIFSFFSMILATTLKWLLKPLTA